MERRHHLARWTCLVLLLCLTQAVQAAAPPLRYAVNVAAGVVRDTATGLIWQRTLSSTTYSWDDAKTYCQELPLDGKRWRLPSIKELLTLIDPTQRMPAIDPTAFPQTPSEQFWTSTPEQASDGYSKWRLDFSYGSTSAMAPEAAYRVRCVQ